MPTNRGRHITILSFTLIFSFAMFLFGYALVPLYNVLCNKLGINGKTNLVSEKNNSAIDTSRTITVEFLASNNANLPWEFHPKIKKIEIHPGEDAVLAYYAKNDSDHTMTIQAVPSVTPGLAAAHLKKTECFCFTQQTLKAHQSMNMPLIFHLDNGLPDNIHEVTLSYTIFEAKNPVKNKKLGKL